jgi:hypothetical protein
MLRRRLRSRLAAATISFLGALALGGTPATATGTTAGTFLARIWFTGYPGIGTFNFCSQQSFSLWSYSPTPSAYVASGGTVATTDAAAPLTGIELYGTATAYPLPLPPPVGCGVSGQENELAGAGVIYGANVYTSSLSDGSLSRWACSDGGNPGSYLRIGLIMLIDLTDCTIPVSGPPGNTPGGQPATFVPPGEIRFAGVVVPDVGSGSNGVTTPITYADYAGVWTGATAS